MNIDLKRLIYILFIIIVQCILDNYIDLGLHLHLMVLPHLILILPYRYKTITAMVIAFAIGITVDIFTTGVLGTNAGALVCTAFIRQKLLYSFLDERNMDNYDSPSYMILGPNKGILYVFCSYFAFCSAYVVLENMGIQPVTFNLLKIVTGTFANGIIGLILFRRYKK